MVGVIGTGLGEILGGGPIEPSVLGGVGAVVGASWVLGGVGGVGLGVGLLERFLVRVGEFWCLVTVEAREILGVGILVWSHFEF